MAKVTKYWWHGKDLAQFFADVEAMGGPEAVRIEFDPGAGLLYVKPEITSEAQLRASQGYNFVHTCPPDCE